MSSYWLLEPHEPPRARPREGTVDVAIVGGGVTGLACAGTIVLFRRQSVRRLTWVALGRTDGEISELIHRSPTTARFHVENAMGKLGARNRAQAVAIACQLGLIHANGPH